jgi:uncharacterized protein YkvS
MAISKETAQKLYELLKQVSCTEEVNEFYTILNQHYSALQTKLVQNFSLGDAVEFDSKRGITVQGIVKKINGKSIKLEATDFVKWTVAPSLLRKIPKSKLRKGTGSSFGS